MIKLSSEEINNFNLRDKFTELKKLSEYKNLTENEFKQLLIENTLSDEEKEEIEDDFFDEVSPTIQKQISIFEKDVNDYKKQIYNSSSKSPIIDLYNKFKELNINIDDINDKSIFNIKSIKKVHNDFLNKYYLTKYNRFIRFFIDLFAYTDKFIKNIPVLNLWNEKYYDITSSFLPYRLSKTQLYLFCIKEQKDKKTNNATINISPIQNLIKSLVENCKSLLIKYSLVQINAEILKKYGINDFGGDYYENLLRYIGRSIQLSKAFEALITYSEINTNSKNFIKADDIIPFMNWLREIWIQEFEFNQVAYPHSKTKKVDILLHMKNICETIINKIPNSAKIVKDLYQSISDLIDNIKNDKNLLLNNIVHIEKTIFLIYLRNFAAKNSIKILFSEEKGIIKIIEIAKINKTKNNKK